MRHNRNSVEVVTPEAVNVVTLSEVKTFIRVDGHDEDALIDSLLDAAIEEARNYTRRSFINRTLKLTLDEFPHGHVNDWWDGVRTGALNELRAGHDVVNLPFAPISSVTSIVTYNDGNVASTFDSSSYRLDTSGGRVILNDGYVWPSDLRDHSAIEITYVSGYGASSTDVPAAIRTAIKMYVQQMHEMRDFCEMPEGCKKMLRSYRIIDRLTLNG